MVTLTQHETRVVKLFQQLSGNSQRKVLLSLASQTALERKERMTSAKTRLQELCRERGLNWDIMSEDEREQFVDKLLHEDL
ncbi:MAG: hypothetical protein GY801_04555 [bacterium]|nr:hypothetical protein [bacterium]